MDYLINLLRRLIYTQKKRKMGRGGGATINILVIELKIPILRYFVDLSNLAHF